MERTDRAVGLSAIEGLLASDGNLLFLGAGVIDRCRATGREPTTPGCRFDHGRGTGWNCDCGARGAGIERALVR